MIKITDIAIDEINSLKKEEFEIPEKYKETCKPGMFKKHYGDNPPVPEYFTPVNNDVSLVSNEKEEIEILKD